MSGIVNAKIVGLLYKLLPQPPYSSNLVSFDFFLFVNMIKWLSEKRFVSKQTLIVKTNTYVAEFKKKVFFGELKEVKHSINNQKSIKNLVKTNLFN